MLKLIMSLCLFFKSVPRATKANIAPGNVLLLHSEKIVNQCANVQMLNATLLVDVISDQKKIQKLVWVFFGLVSLHTKIYKIIF